MNRLLGKQAGFPLGPTINAATKGIWAWITDHPTRPNHNLLLLDTEGLSHATDGDENRDIQIFVLSVILSSTLIYNCQGVIDESCLELLDLVSELSEHLVLRVDDEGNVINMDRIFPALHFVVRDFMLELVVDGQPCSPTTYLEHCLKIRRGFGEKTRLRNNSRDKLKSYFPNRSCFVLPRPVTEDEALKQVDEVPEDQLQPAFVDGVTQLVSTIHAQSEPKKVRGVWMNSRHLVEIARNCVLAFRQDKIPSVENAVVAVRQAECLKAVEMALQFYKIAMQDTVEELPLQEDELKRRHRHNFDNCAERTFAEYAIFDDDGEFYNRMKADIEKEYTMICKNNESEALRLCREMLDVLFTSIVQKKIDEDEYSYSDGHLEYIQDLQKVFVLYDEYPKKGPAYCARQVREDFENEKQTQTQLIHQTAGAVAKKEQEIETHRVLIELEKQQNADAQQALEERLDRLQIDHEENLRRLEQEKGEMREQYEERIRRVNSEKQHEIQIRDAEAQRISRELEHRMRLTQEQLDAQQRRADQSADQIRLLMQQNRNLEEGLRHANSRSRGGGGGCAIM
ncbi:guanylate-binding protein 1-like [Lingula anatina]|uniref:Guanylate-binding protein 1-like n=1 Tax=Lingula anatina TaxID=7574 RepID=A0A1S3ISF3_LINAN|nr:guanylate-binding protein 1-like [Lingula anatina]|eukprot:XP_013401003.1 guanylate-binding protein 1-like [Lingula anatina]